VNYSEKIRNKAAVYLIFQEQAIVVLIVSLGDISQLAFVRPPE